MKGFAIATTDGHCAYDREHRWKAGDKVMRLQGQGWKRAKDYCWTCGQARYGASEQTPEFSFGPQAQAPVRPLKGLVERFDAKLARLGKDDG